MWSRPEGASLRPSHTLLLSCCCCCCIFLSTGCAMLPPQAKANSLSKRHILIAVVTVTTLWYLTFHDITGFGAPSAKISVAIWNQTQQVDSEASLQEQFVSKALYHDIYVSEYNGTAVRKLCSEAKWRDDVVASCDKLGGGIGNLKVNLLACMRYTVESGGVYCPSRRKRDRAAARG